MYSNKINKSTQAKLYNTLFGNTSSFRRKGVNIGIFAHSGIAANITIRVSGLNGTAEKNIVLVYDTQLTSWVVYCDGIEYVLDGISDITIIIKNRIQKLHTLVSKL